MRSSSSLSNCRIDWRPSRLLAGALVILGVAAAVSVALSAAPLFVALPMGLLALVVGLKLAHRELHRPTLVLSWVGGTNELHLEHAGQDEAWHEALAVFRGGLVTVSGLDEAGHRQQLHWWPDTLPAEARRRLRLASTIART